MSRNQETKKIITKINTFRDERNSLQKELDKLEAEQKKIVEKIRNIEKERAVLIRKVYPNVYASMRYPDQTTSWGRSHIAYASGYSLTGVPGSGGSYYADNVDWRTCVEVKSSDRPTDRELNEICGFIDPDEN